MTLAAVKREILTLVDGPGLGDFAMVCLDLPQDEIHQIEASTGEKYNPDRVAAALFLNKSDACWSILIQGVPLVVCGGTEIRPGVWDIYYLAREVAWSRHGPMVTQITQGLIQSFFYDLKAHRLEVRCLAGRHRARRWYEKHLGLEYEGTARRAGADGEDFALYSITRAS